MNSAISRVFAAVCLAAALLASGTIHAEAKRAARVVLQRRGN